MLWPAVGAALVGAYLRRKHVGMPEFVRSGAALAIAAAVLLLFDATAWLALLIQIAIIARR